METTFLHEFDPEQRHEALRYMVERARTFWPACVVQDPQGEQYGRLSRLLPVHITIRPVGKSSRYNVIEIEIDHKGVHVRWFKLSADLARHLLDDPVWGPDWLVNQAGAR